jgi:hypothetical protein
MGAGSDCPPSQEEIPGISTRQLHFDGCTSVIVADHLFSGRGCLHSDRPSHFSTTAAYSSRIFLNRTCAEVFTVRLPQSVAGCTCCFGSQVPGIENLKDELEQANFEPFQIGLVLRRNLRDEAKEISNTSSFSQAAKERFPKKRLPEDMHNQP